MKTKMTNSKRSKSFGSRGLFSNREYLTGLLDRWRQKLSFFTIVTALPGILISLAEEAQAHDPQRSETLPAGQIANLLQKNDKSLDKSGFQNRQSNYFLKGKKGSNSFSLLSGGDDCPGNAIPGGTFTASSPYTDAGTTIGANNTVGSICSAYCYGSYDTPGPDHIYSFTITARDANPMIRVSATSGTYNPSIYILRGSNYPGCPGGTNNSVSNNFNSWIYPSQNGIAEINMAYAPLNTPLYLFIDSEVTGEAGSGSYTVRFQDLTIAGPAVAPRTKFDFDGDRRADISVFRPTDSVWYLNRSSQNFYAARFGHSTDKITPGDFDGDGQTDIAVYREGTWYWLDSSDGSFSAAEFGLPGDIPVPADYDGDGRFELAIYRDGLWWILNLSNEHIRVAQFGLSSDKPVIGDYDGDGKTDLAVFRNGVWYIDQSSEGFKAFQWGFSTDIPVPDDYDGDGKTDVAIYRDGFWYLQKSRIGFTAFRWGNSNDIPVPADYDGDGQTDAAVFRNGMWYLLQSASGVSIQQFGLTDDKPIPSSYLP